jgi:hypothetical protein
MVDIDPSCNIAAYRSQAIALAGPYSLVRALRSVIASYAIQEIMLGILVLIGTESPTLSYTSHAFTRIFGQFG